MTIPQKSPRMMIVDDEEALRQALRRLLERRGMSVVGEATNGIEAVQVAAAVRPDIILMDLRMPQLDGLEATKQIKAILPDVCVIMTTAYTDQAFRDEAGAVGVSAYIVKGTKPSVMKAAIDEAWAQNQALSAA
jgi:two-component system response regulator YesN